MTDVISLKLMHWHYLCKYLTHSLWEKTRKSLSPSKTIILSEFLIYRQFTIIWSQKGQASHNPRKNNCSYHFFFFVIFMILILMRDLLQRYVIDIRAFDFRQNSMPLYPSPYLEIEYKESMFAIIKQRWVRDRKEREASKKDKLQFICNHYKNAKYDGAVVHFGPSYSSSR